MEYYNSRNPFYKQPFGAVATNTMVTFKIIVPENYGDTPFLLIKNTDGATQEIAMTLQNTLDGCHCFMASFSPLSAQLHFYYFKLEENRYLSHQGKGIGFISPQPIPFQLTVFDRSFCTPQQAKGAIIYQIFPDRFYESKPKPSLHFSDRIYRHNKAGEPYFYPTEQPNGYLNKDYFGGDLQGIIEKIDYLKDLNISYIYLNPIFEAHANHRYNTADYLKIDPDLGTLADFNTLCKVAHQHGIGIILDGVFSHTGSDSVYFNKEGRYEPAQGAFQDENSPYRDWYDFSEKYPCGYRSWWGFESLPEVNELSESYQDFICGKNGVLAFWLSQGADGFRLDVADELPDAFIEKIRTTLKSQGKDTLLIGEVWEDASNKISYHQPRTYLLGKGLDATMNYPFREAILSFFEQGDGFAFADKIITLCENYPKPALDVMWNHLSTHDTARIMTQLCGENGDSQDRFWQSKRYLSIPQYEKGQKLVPCAFAVLFTLPGNPCIYYGDEIGMQGYKDPFNRGYFRWWAMDTYILNAVKKIALFRKENAVFQEGDIYFVFAQQDGFAFVRCDGQQEVLCGVNRGVQPLSFVYRNQEFFLPPMGYLLKKM